MEKKTPWQKYGTFIIYCIFGFTATVLETFLYWVFYRKAGLDNVPATVIAIFFTITYAFFTNKIMVYRSRDWRLNTLMKELGEFYAFRIATALFNIGYMYVTVSILDWPAVPMKAVAAVFVGIMNYVLGKLVVFKDRRSDN